ncbi:hypothetical protein LPJ54_004382 [Coemansia sp. RSA 1824]|nr:hypothetical protein LPJ54_004382 [Coemansia sp. RSA 1824]
MNSEKSLSNYSTLYQTDSRTHDKFVPPNTILQPSSLPKRRKCYCPNSVQVFGAVVLSGGICPLYRRIRKWQKGEC